MKIESLAQGMILNNQDIDTYIAIGTMSSGKSTLLNSLIGFELFPSRNEACTAKVISYYANPLRNEFIYINKLNKEPIISKKLDYRQIEKWNKSSRLENILVEGPIQSGKKKCFAIIDTPGPNNSIDQSHRNIMKNAIHGRKFKKVLYILNATQIGTEDDQNLLKYMKSQFKVKKIIFVVNKSDEIDDTEEENLHLLSKNVKNYLQKNGFKKPRIYFVSSLSALLALKIINGCELTRKQSYDYRRLNILLEENLDSYNINTFSKKKSNFKITNELWSNSGIPELLTIL